MCHFVIYCQVIKYLITSLILTLILINTQRIGIKDRVWNKMKWMNSLDHTLLHVELYTASISFLAREAFIVILNKMFAWSSWEFILIFPSFFLHPSIPPPSISPSLFPSIPFLYSTTHPSLSSSAFFAQSLNTSCISQAYLHLVDI